MNRTIRILAAYLLAVFFSQNFFAAHRTPEQLARLERARANRERTTAVINTADSAIRRELPSSDDFATILSGLESNPDEFDFKHFAFLIYKNVESVLLSKQLDMPAFRSLVAEWNKGETVDIAEFINQYKRIILQQLHTQLSDALQVWGQHRALTPLVEQKF